MMYVQSLLWVVIVSILFISDSNADFKRNGKDQGKQIVIELSYIPKGIKPGDKPITLNPPLLSRLLPELRNPRLMSIKDLNDSDEQEGFFEGGYSFVLRGDFNKDGFADIAFVGKYDNQSDSEKNSFIAIVSIRGRKVIREYFSRLETKKAYLIRVIDFKPQADAIGIVYNLYSEECGYLYWGKGQYNFKPCRASF